jgi:uncharacterized lipoprotein YmbA
MDAWLRRIGSCAAGLSLLVLGGCTDLLGLKGGSAPVHYYVLSSVPSPSGRTGGVASDEIVVGVAPVTVAEYLESRMIVTRTTANTVELAELHNWAAPLSEHATAVLADNLSTQIPTDAVLKLPLSRSIPIDVEVRVRLETFEQVDDGNVRLVARWVLFDERTGRATEVRTSRYQAPVVAGRGPAAREDRADSLAEEYEAIVAAMSRVLADLSREIADAIRAQARARS